MAPVHAAAGSLSGVPAPFGQQWSRRHMRAQNVNDLLRLVSSNQKGSHSLVQTSKTKAVRERMLRLA